MLNLKSNQKNNIQNDIPIAELVENLKKDNIQSYLLNLVNKISNLYPELKENKNNLLLQLNENIKKHKLNLKKIKTFSFLYKIASDIVGEKAEKLTKFQNLIEKATLPTDLKDKMLKEKEKMSNIIINAYGMLKQAIEYGDDRTFKTAVVSALLLGVDNDKEKDATIIIFRDINREENIDYSKVENFFENSKEITKLDTYIKELQKLISISEKEKEQQKTKSSEIEF